MPTATILDAVWRGRLLLKRRHCDVACLTPAHIVYMDVPRAQARGRHEYGNCVVAAADLLLYLPLYAPLRHHMLRARSCHQLEDHSDIPFVSR
jgi:hypothetical protein